MHSDPESTQRSATLREQEALKRFRFNLKHVVLDPDQTIFSDGQSILATYLRW